MIHASLSDAFTCDGARPRQGLCCSFSCGSVERQQWLVDERVLPSDFSSMISPVTATVICLGALNEVRANLQQATLAHDLSTFVLGKRTPSLSVAVEIRSNLSGRSWMESLRSCKRHLGSDFFPLCRL